MGIKKIEGTTAGLVRNLKQTGFSSDKETKSKFLFWSSFSHFYIHVVIILNYMLMHKLKHVNILQKFAGVCDFFIQLNIAKCVTRFHK